VKLLRMIGMYSMKSARQLTPGQQMTVVDGGIGQSSHCIYTRFDML